MTKPKFALCVRSSDLPPAWQQATTARTLPIHDAFWNPKALVVADRAHCETDPTLQQLLPYIVLRDEFDRVFCYARGAGGAEARLHAKMSVGVGGHVDEAPPRGVSLIDWLRLEAQREIHEEVGIVVGTASIDFQSFLVDRGSPVGEVHLGLLAVVKVRSDLVASAEKDIITEGRFAHLDEISELFPRLEPWSQLAVTPMLAARAGALMEAS
jgi:predicted NUDIX family phosphoesterase